MPAGGEELGWTGSDYAGSASGVDTPFHGVFPLVNHCIRLSFRGLTVAMLSI